MNRPLPWILICLAAIVGCDDPVTRPSPVAIDTDEAVRAPFIAGFERFHRIGGNALEGGLLLLGESGCTACHKAPDDTLKSVSHKTAPRLNRVGERLDPEYLRNFLATPSNAKPGTTMPGLLEHLEGVEKDAVVEDLTHYLVSLGRNAFNPVSPDFGAAARGDGLFHRVGCVACHAPRGKEGPQLENGSVPLPDMAAKWSWKALRDFLRNPLSIRPSGRMPDLRLSGREADDIAHFLLRDTRVPGTLRYAYHDKRRRNLEGLADEVPRLTGLANGFDVAVAKREHNFSLRFIGWLRVDKKGPHTFHLNSDDGSRLHIDGELVVENGGERRQHKTKAAEGARELEPGWHEIVVEYFQMGKERVLGVEWSPPDGSRGPIPAERLRAWPVEIEPRTPLDPEPERIARGRGLFGSLGCAACHETGDLAVIKTEARPLTELRVDRGCLGDVSGAHPHYSFDPTQKAALRLALHSLSTGFFAPPTRAERVSRSFESLNCFACHARGTIEGVPEERDPWFTCDGTNQGMEGRIPPHLNGVGEKLLRPWLERVLVDGVSVRPLFHTRMPRFGRENVQHLVDDLIALDRGDPAAQPAVVTTDEVKEAGRILVGAEGGMNCISCHHFNKREASTMQMVDMSSVHERLDPGWFRKFMADPAAINPGTRMPQFTPLKHVLDGNMSQQIDAIWAYLGDGTGAVNPKGLDRKGHELIVGGRSIVYRGKFREVGFRGIAVGHPEERHILFDATTGRLAQLWKGRFLNVGAHWGVQGMGRIRPHGHDVITLPAGNSLARLANPDSPWPTESKFKLGGYQLDETGRATFFYRLDGLEVEDMPGAVRDGDTSWVQRRIAVANHGRLTDVHLRLAMGAKIESTAGGHRVDDKMTIRISGSGTPRIRGAAGTMELVAPVPFLNGRTEIIVEYLW